jgi:hypothetical protein
MKKTKILMIAIMIMVSCVGFGGCGDDEYYETTPSSL